MKYNKKKIKVLTIVNSLNMGGIEKTLLACIQLLKSNNIDLIICCFNKEGKLLTSFRELDVKIFTIKKTGLIFLDFLQLFFFLFLRRIDVVHSRFGYTSGGFVLATKLAGKKSVVSIHSSSPSAFRKFRHKKLIYRLLGFQLYVHKCITRTLADRIVGHSESNLNANFTDWRDNPKFIVIYNGVEFSKLEKRVSNPNLLDTFREIGDFILLHIGSMRPEKNHFFMIDCLQWLNKVNPHYKLILIGDGELFPIVKAYVNELELSERVLFVGHEMNIQPYYSDADLFFFPSTNEGFGNVIVEAQYLNLPVCCSNIKPLLESSYNGYHKFVFNPFQISDAVESILKMEENMCKIKEIIVPKAHNYVTSHFSIQNMVNDLTTMYRSLLDEV